MQPASAKWYDRRDYVFIEFCVEDSKDVNVNFEKSKLTFSCLGGSDNFKHLNEIDLFHSIDPNDSKHKRTDRSILCCLRKGESGQSWPRLTKERAKLNWLSVDFNNWKDWEDDSDEDMSNFDRFSEPPSTYLWVLPVVACETLPQHGLTSGAMSAPRIQTGETLGRCSRARELNHSATGPAP
uniref:Prostaglandin E synthase 3 n=1 Tax=Equus asinus TaxID=9793 RepID=A0A9L0JLB2_EQUAS